MYVPRSKQVHNAYRKYWDGKWASDRGRRSHFIVPVYSVSTLIRGKANLGAFRPYDNLYFAGNWPEDKSKESKDIAMFNDSGFIDGRMEFEGTSLEACITEVKTILKIWYAALKGHSAWFLRKHHVQKRLYMIVFGLVETSHYSRINGITHALRQHSRVLERLSAAEHFLQVKRRVPTKWFSVGLATSFAKRLLVSSGTRTAFSKAHCTQQWFFPKGKLRHLVQRIARDPCGWRIPSCQSWSKRRTYPTRRLKTQFDRFMETRESTWNRRPKDTVWDTFLDSSSDYAFSSDETSEEDWF
jgi:hypothetical protein